MCKRFFDKFSVFVDEELDIYAGFLRESFQRRGLWKLLMQRMFFQRESVFGLRICRPR